MLKYQIVLVEQNNVEFKVTPSVNPAMFLQASEEAQRPLYHDCLLTLNKCVLADRISRAIQSRTRNWSYTLMRAVGNKWKMVN